MQVSPSGMAAASQAASGEFDSRHLLQKFPIVIQSEIFSFSASLNFSIKKAFPLGGRCRRTATNEGG